MKWLLYPLLALLALIVIALLVVVFAPSAVLTIVNSVQSSVHVQASELHTRLSPLSLTAESMEVRASGTDIAVVDATIGVGLAEWWNDQPFLTLVAESVEITNTATSASDTQDTPDTPETADGQSGSFSLDPLFIVKHVDIERVTVDTLSLALQADQADNMLSVLAKGTMDASAFDVQTGLGTIHPHSLDASLMWELAPDEPLHATVQGELQTDQAYTLRLEHADVRVDGASPIHLADLNGAVSLAHDMNQANVDDLQTSITIGDATIPLVVTANVANLSAAPTVQFETRTGDTSLQGSMEALDSLESWRFASDLEAQSWPAWAPLPMYQPAHVTPLTLKTSGQWQPANLRLESLTVRSPTNSADATLSLAYGDKLVLKGELAATQLFLPLLGPDTQEEETGEDERKEEAQDPKAAADAPAEEANADTAAPSPQKEDPLFSQEPIDWSWLDTADVDLKLTADLLVIQEAQFENFDTSITSSDAGLALSRLAANMGEGGFSGTGSLTPAEQGVSANFQFDLNAVPLEAFGFVPQEELTGGHTDLYIQLTTHGVSAHDLGAHTNGELYAIVEKATLQNDLIELVGSDLIFEVLEKLNPFIKDDPTTELECALVRFEAEDGVLSSNDQLVLETTKMEIKGQGKLNLNDEALKITFSPTPKSGVGLSAGSLVKFLGLGGTIRNPGLALDAAGTLKTGLAVGAALSTGGASLLAEGLVQRAVNAGSACAAFRKSLAERNTANE